MNFPDFITSHLSVPFEWGKNDCVTFVARWVSEATGSDPLEDIPKWSTEQEARRAIFNVGGLSAEMDRKFQRINPNYANDGDIAMHKGCLRLYTGNYICGPGPNGLVMFNRMEAECAWRCC